MRDPKRLKNCYEQIAMLHEKHVPDWRIGQLFSNFMGWCYSEKKRDLFFPEEGEFVELLREFLVKENEVKEDA